MTLSLFQVSITQLDPANLGSADASHFGVGEDGLEYVIKCFGGKVPTVPASEYICSSLAASVSIATPRFAVVIWPNGEEAFGSEWECGVRDRQFTHSVLHGSQPARALQPNLSRIYAFDLFTCNVDRHFDNYLCVAQRNSMHTLKAMDYSRAWHCHGWPLPALPLAPASNTMTHGRILRQQHGFDLAAATDTLQRLKTVAVDEFRRVLDRIPARWLEKRSRNSMIKWWAQERFKRIDQIGEGLKNGNYL